MHDDDNNEKARSPLARATDATSREALPRAAPRRMTSHELFGAAREIVIAHDGRNYQLRITQNGKLILTA